MSSWENAIFGGRTPRVGFWFGLVGVYVLLLLTFLPFNLLGGAISVCSSALNKIVVAACLLIPSFLLLRVGGRRLHDLGWPGWPAFILPMLVFIEGETAKDSILYSCDIGVLSPVYDALAAAMPVERWIAAVSPLLQPFSFTINGMEVDLLALAIPLLLYLGLYPGVRGANRYGADPNEKPPTVDAAV